MRRWLLTLLALGAFPTLAATQTTTQVVEYYHTDALGSVRAVTKQVNGVWTVVSRHDFMPFGEEVQPTVAPPYNRLFTGKERDNETGLDYFEARYLRTANGRFTSVDPHSIIAEATSPEEFYTFLSRPQNWNRYAYVTNSPLSTTDPDGRCPTCLIWLQQLAVRAAPYADRAAQVASRWGNQAAQATSRYGQQAYVWATQFFNSPTGQEVVQTAAELATGASAGPVSALPFRSGDVITREFSTGVGTVSMMAEAVVSGQRLHLKDIAVYPKDAKVLEVGTKGMLDPVNQLKAQARELGFTELRITGLRLSGAKPGKKVDLLLDLTENKWPH
jgi:RHS repeat-associated protein